MQDSYVPAKPFPSYKWFWACKQPTEALNDPAVLFGVLRIICSLSGSGVRYSSPQFAERLRKLGEDVITTVDLRNRVGKRNLLRNSGQYWSALGLIPASRYGGVITITDFGASVATNAVGQEDFAASVIAGFSLPNKATYSAAECEEWRSHGLTIYPLRLILEVMQKLFERGAGWLTPRETAKIVVPMAGDGRDAVDMADHILGFRERPESYDSWPDCVPEANDMRFIREYFLFLNNYGFVDRQQSGFEGPHRFDERYSYLSELDEVVNRLVKGDGIGGNLFDGRAGGVSATVTSTVISRRAQRPGQAQFRRRLLNEIGQCPVTNVDLPDVLEAAHIKPHVYGGSMTLDNGWPMRVDIHRLFDSGKLRIKPDGGYGRIEFTDEDARRNYFELDNKAIIIPEATNMEYVQWRYDNYMVGMRIDE